MTSEQKNAPKLISASRRTDIPRFYARWFGERRRQGFAESRTVFGVPGRISLRRADVLGFLFWTRDARPFMKELEALRSEGIPYAFQFTINGYGRELEPRRPGVAEATGSFLAVSSSLRGPESIQWRYDPIVVSDRYPAADHVRRFEGIARELAGATRVVNVSFVEPYAKAIRRIADPGVQYRAVDPERHRSVARRHPDLPVVKEADSLLRELSGVAEGLGIELRVCCNPEYSGPLLGLPNRSQCIGPELFAPYGDEILARVSSLPEAPSRSACRCLQSRDIGMDETCPGGCKYCYVTKSGRTSLENFEKHDPNSPTLR
jgi:hypothetical protein